MCFSYQSALVEEYGPEQLPAYHYTLVRSDQRTFHQMFSATCSFFWNIFKGQYARRQWFYCWFHLLLTILLSLLRQRVKFFLLLQAYLIAIPPLWV